MDGFLVVIACDKQKVWDRHPKAGRTAARYAYEFQKTAGLSQGTTIPALHLGRPQSRCLMSWIILAAWHTGLASASTRRNLCPC